MVAQFVSIYFLSLCQVVYCKHTLISIDTQKLPKGHIYDLF